MQITLFMAMSANGMIASEGGSEDFLSDSHWTTFASLVEEFGNFIVGRNTYEAVQNWGEDYGFDDFQSAKRIIVSDEPGYALKPGYDLSTSPSNAIALLEEAGFERGLLAGGSSLNASFATEGLIDEVILSTEPAIVGAGIPLFSTQDFLLRLKLREVEKKDGDIVQLRYQVDK